MSKFPAMLSYKDWCILKHSLEMSIDSREEWLQAISDGEYERYEKEKEELEEEKRTLKRVTTIVDNIKIFIGKEGK